MKRAQAALGITHQRGLALGRWRQGTEAYAGAERARHLEALRIGAVCPVCGRGGQYAVPPKVERRLDGNALLSAIRDALKQLRCSVCKAV